MAFSKNTKKAFCDFGVFLVFGLRKAFILLGVFLGGGAIFLLYTAIAVMSPNF